MNQNDKTPRPAEWEPFFDYRRDEITGETPMCPNCHDPLYNYERCMFCGQKIKMDAKLKEWLKPPKVEHRDCFVCGGKGTLEFVRVKPNNHAHGHCTACGMRFME